MGDYAPEDQRAVHNDNDATWREQEEGAQDDSARAQPGENSSRPDERAAADADRPLGDS